MTRMYSCPLADFGRDPTRSMPTHLNGTLMGVAVMGREHIYIERLVDIEYFIE